MLPMIEREVVRNKGWATSEEVMDYFAVGQCTPGVIAVNTSTFIGYKLKGIRGGITATLGFTAPSLIIIMIIAAFMTNFSELKAVQSAFWGHPGLCLRSDDQQYQENGKRRSRGLAHRHDICGHIFRHGLCHE